MGLIKTLLSGDDEEPGMNSKSPEEAKRSAAEAELDRMIAARAAAAETDRIIAARAGAANAPPAQANVLATMRERRSGLDRREREPKTFSSIEDRRSGVERRGGTVKTGPAAEFGRRGGRPT